MALARYEREKEQTIGEGDCAFNAFTLALCDPAVFSQIERSIKSAGEDINLRFETFILHVSQTLDVDAAWDAVKAELLRLHQDDKDKLQRSIAPIMRMLSINIARTSHDAVYLKSETVDKLVSVYNDYARKKTGKTVTNQDDIFSRHRFITDKFYEIYWGQNKDKMDRRKAIENWWWNEGYDQFLDEMAKPKVWAGDLELARLAKYFNVVLNCVPDEGFLYNIHGDYGYFPFLNDEIGKNIPRQDRAEVMELLHNRFVLAPGHENVHQFGVNFLMTNLGHISRRLRKVPNDEQVTNFIQSQEKLKGQLAPAAWPTSCLDELIQRNVIGRNNDGKTFSFSVDANTALQCIAEVPHYREIMKICGHYFQSHPTLVLHKSPDHWSNTLRIISPEEMAQQERMKRLMDNGLFGAGAVAYGSVTANVLRLSPGGVVSKKN